MATPLGGPSQIVVKCRNNDDYDGVDILPGDAVSLLTTSYDTETGEPIFWITKSDTTAASASNFLGIALSRASKGLAGSTGTGGSLEPTGGSHGRGYCHVCVFGLVPAKVASHGTGSVAAGEAVYAIASHGGAAYSDGASGRGVLYDNALLASGAVVAGMAPQSGNWGTTGDSSGAKVTSWVFINGIGRHAFGGS